MNKINFLDVNGFVKLVKGESTKFSFFKDEEKDVCDASCDVRCKQIQLAAVTPPKPFVLKKDSIRGPTYLPPISNDVKVEKKDEALTPKKTTSYYTTRTTRPSPSMATTSQPRVETTTRAVQTTRTAFTTTRAPFTTTRAAFTTRAAVTTYRPAYTTRAAEKTTTRRRSTPGPAYLPISKISTSRGPTTTERSYPPATWPSSTRLYTQTYPTWNAPSRRSTEAKIASSTAKYLYKEPSNSLIYAGEEK